MTIKEALKKKETRKYLCEKSLMYFSIYYFTKYHFFKMPEFHKDWYKDLMFSDLVGVILVTFRESGKTSLAKIKIIHSICYSRKKFIIWTSYDQTKAEANLYDIALELQTNKRIIADFGNLFFEEKSIEKFTKKKSIGEFITTNKIKVKAYSTGQSPRGEVYGEYRPDFIVLDDIETLKTIESEPKTHEVMQYIDELLSGLSGNANVLVLGNRLLEGGSISYIESKVSGDEKWRTHDIPVVINDEIVWKDKYVWTNKQAERINKDIEDEYKHKISLENKQKLLGYQAYNREMLNTPITEEEREFKNHWLKYREPKELEHKRVRRFLTIDTAISEKESADSTGIVDNSIDDDNFWNIRAYKYRINPKELIDLLFRWQQERSFEAIGIEKTIYLQAIKPFLEEEMRRRNQFLPITELQHNQTAKETRIRGLIPRYESRSVFHIKGECKELEDEMHVFPKGLHDDVLDACFVAGTKVLMGNKTKKNIEKIQVGDYVMTRNGAKKVLNAGETGKKQVIKKVGLCGTPNHPVITSCGEKDLIKLNASDTIYIWNEKQLSIEKGNITDTLNTKTDNIGFIIGRTPNGIKRQLHYIAKFTKITLVKFLKDIVSTIETGTHLITNRKILKLYQCPNTLKCIQDSQTGEKALAKEHTNHFLNFKGNQENGEKQKRGKNGIKNTLKNQFLENHKKGYVLNVRINILQRLKCKLNTVVENVKAEQIQENLDEKIRTTTVYNLEVEDEHEYFANNILVHNCAYQLQITKNSGQKMNQTFKPKWTNGY